MLSNTFIESEIHNLAGMSLILRISKYLGVLFCILACHNSLRVSRQKAVLFCGLLCLAIVNMFFVQGGSGLIEILIVVFCIGLIKANASEVFACGICTLVGGHVFIMFLSLIGVLKDNVSSRWFGNYMGSFFAGEYVRHQMGFLASNQVPLTLMIVYLMIIVYKQSHVTIAEHALFLVANFGVL